MKIFELIFRQHPPSEIYTNTTTKLSITPPEQMCSLTPDALLLLRTAGLSYTVNGGPESEYLIVDMRKYDSIPPFWTPIQGGTPEEKIVQVDVEAWKDTLMTHIPHKEIILMTKMHNKPEKEWYTTKHGVPLSDGTPMWLTIRSTTGMTIESPYERIRLQTYPGRPMFFFYDIFLAARALCRDHRRHYLDFTIVEDKDERLVLFVEIDN